MEQLKNFLIIRLLAVMGIVLAAEIPVMGLVRALILPLAAYLANIENSSGSLGPGDILTIIAGIFSGGQTAAMSVLLGSGTFLLVLLAFIALLLPPAAGILIYARMVAARVDTLQKERESERNLMLSDFAHDLRTPVTTISGYAAALTDGLVKDPDTEREYLLAIRQKSMKLGELIGLLFDYARLGSVDYKLNRTKCDINAIAAEAAATLYSDIENAGMELEAFIPENPFTVNADPAQAGRIFSNLITNAVRHNPPGTRIALIIRPAAGGEMIAVADSGVVIDKDIDGLFKPFVRGDETRKSSGSGDTGSGLGLSIVKKIADLHKWDLSFEQPFEGYTKAFILRIPDEL
ncbi:MAG: HAMP domain-containing histidine kinase [Lachnospiraceae bacterium]|nr:HAMP domain-containing histidine kinase [Lachnospiraceae bacterium]